MLLVLVFYSCILTGCNPLTVNNYGFRFNNTKVDQAAGSVMTYPKTFIGLLVQSYDVYKKSGCIWGLSDN